MKKKDIIATIILWILFGWLAIAGLTLLFLWSLVKNILFVVIYCKASNPFKIAWEEFSEEFLEEPLR